MLLSIYISDLLCQIDDQNLELLEMSKNVMTSCLAYANDLLIISKTANGLHKTLQTLESSCTTWQMVFNTEKTKSITFPKKPQKQQVNENEMFHLNGKILSNVAEFVYLGLKIDF